MWLRFLKLFNLILHLENYIFYSNQIIKSMQRSHGDNHPSSPQPPPSYYENHGPPAYNPPAPHPPPPARRASPPPPGGGKLSAADISKGLGLGDDDE